jgi:hypothetical protein
MTANDAFHLLKQFFLDREAPKRALASLKEGTEIGLEIGSKSSPELVCAVFRQGEQVFIERRAPERPDFVFSLSPETVSILANQTADDIGEIGINLFKEVLIGSVSIRMPGGLLSVVKNGYFEVVASGGPRVAAFLAEAGLGSPMRVLHFLKRLRQRT